MRGEATGMVCGGLAEVFLEVLQAPPLLAICGGGPVGQALAAARHARLASICWCVEDRDEFARAELFPPGTRDRARGSRDYADDFLPREPRPLRRDRDPLLGDRRRGARVGPASGAAALRYLGLMGSRRKIERVKQEVEALGHSLADVALSAPIGLPLGGTSPGEIAIAILAEIIQQRRAVAAKSQPGPRRVRRR